MPALRIRLSSRDAGGDRADPAAVTVGRLIAALLVPVVLVAAGVLLATADASCSEAKALKKAELYEEAAARYTRILEEEPSSECAKRGMKATIRGLCDRGNRLQGANHQEAANKVYAVALGLEPAPKTWTCKGSETKGVRGPRGKRGPRGRRGRPGRNCCTG
jgi:hypothetical protein